MSGTVSFVLAALAGTLAATSALAFNCSLPEGPGSPYPLYEKPSASSKVIAQMPAGDRIRLTTPVRDRGDFTHVRWTPADHNAKGRRGWVDRLKTHGGECED